MGTRAPVYDEEKAEAAEAASFLRSLLLMVELRSAMAAQDARKVMKRKKARRDTARSSRGVLDDEKMRRRLGSAMRGRGGGQAGSIGGEGKGASMWAFLGVG